MAAKIESKGPSFDLTYFIAEKGIELEKLYAEGVQAGNENPPSDAKVLNLIIKYEEFKKWQTFFGERGKSDSTMNYTGLTKVLIAWPLQHFEKNIFNTWLKTAWERVNPEPSVVTILKRFDALRNQFFTTMKELSKNRCEKNRTKVVFSLIEYSGPMCALSSLLERNGNLLTARQNKDIAKIDMYVTAMLCQVSPKLSLIRVIDAALCCETIGEKEIRDVQDTLSALAGSGPFPFKNQNEWIAMCPSMDLHAFMEGVNAAVNHAAFSENLQQGEIDRPFLEDLRSRISKNLSDYLFDWLRRGKKLSVNQVFILRRKLCGIVGGNRNKVAVNLNKEIGYLIELVPFVIERMRIQKPAEFNSSQVESGSP